MNPEVVATFNQVFGEQARNAYSQIFGGKDILTAADKTNNDEVSRIGCYTDARTFGKHLCGNNISK